MSALMSPPPDLRAAIPSGITASNLMASAAQAFGGSAADGAFSIKDASELMEMALNHVIVGDPRRFDPTVGFSKAKRIIADLHRTLEKLPTQTGRDAESQALQQFSTPPHYAYLVAWVANLRASDTVLEPSAGTGSLAVHALNAGCRVAVNEISERRVSILRSLSGSITVFTENAEQLDVLLPPDVKPDVVLMNPPFSVSVNQPGRKIPAACVHIDQALLRLNEGGRLVAVMGRGSFPAWWAQVRATYTLRAIVGIPGKEFRKLGTNTDTQICVIDKAGPTVEEPVLVDAESVEDALSRLCTVRDRRGERPRVQQVRKAKDQGPGLFDLLGGSNAGTETTRNTPSHSSDQVKQSGEGGKSGRLVASHIGSATLGMAASQKRETPPPLAIQTAAVTAASPLTDAIFEPYHAQRLVIPGAQEHPTPLVQSAAMASVLPPEPTYRPRIPMALVENAVLSLPQLEAIVYAGQAHEQFLPGTKIRRGFMVGDSTGTGKSRILGGNILDSFHNGRRRALWITKNARLRHDAVRDWTDLGGSPDDIIDLGKLKASERIPERDGILFVTYGLLGGKDKQGNERMTQIIEWLGDDFDGVIGFDESHAAKNCVCLK